MKGDTAMTFAARRLHIKARFQTRFLLNRYRVWAMDGAWR